VGLRPAAVGRYLSAIADCVDLSEDVAHARAQRERGGEPRVPDAAMIDIADLAARKRLGIDSK
jgi:hypothetical protein